VNAWLASVAGYNVGGHLLTICMHTAAMSATELLLLVVDTQSTHVAPSATHQPWGTQLHHLSKFNSRERHTQPEGNCEHLVSIV
jgi:hypothetical protein